MACIPWGSSENPDGWASSKASAITVWCALGAKNFFRDYDVLSCEATSEGASKPSSLTGSIKDQLLPRMACIFLAARLVLRIPLLRVVPVSAVSVTLKAGQCVSKQSPDMKCAVDFTMAGFGIGAGMGTIRDTKTMAGVAPSGEVCWPYDSASSGCLVNFDRTGLTTMPNGSIQSTGTFTMYKGGVGGKACTVEASTGGDTEVSEKCEQKGSYTDSKGTHNLCLDAPKCEGGFGGEVNGVEVCVTDKGGNVIETEKKSETTKPNGDKEQVKETTVCKGNVCTTTTATNTTDISGGTSTKTETKTEGKEDYCKANANAQQCKGEDDKKAVLVVRARRVSRVRVTRCNARLRKTSTSATVRCSMTQLQNPGCMTLSQPRTLTVMSPKSCPGTAKWMCRVI